MTELSDDQFHTDLQNEDELGAVIRGHLHIEHSLNELLKRQIPFFERLEKLNHDYEVKVALALAMGLNREYEKPLKGVGLLRNKYAHKPGFKISKSDTANLYKAFSAEDRKIIQGAYFRTNKNLKKNNIPFSQHKPIDQFIMLAITIRQILILACKEWKGERPDTSVTK
jgi:hypothetical protein